eukprot:699939-Rhodomonas_salina.1
MTGMVPVTMQGNAAPVLLGVCRECMCRAAAWDGAGCGGEWGDGELAATSMFIGGLVRAGRSFVNIVKGNEKSSKVQPRPSSPSSSQAATSQMNRGGEGSWLNDPLENAPNPKHNPPVRGSGGGYWPRSTTNNDIGDG